MKDQFTKSGFLHRLIKRAGMIAIFERSRVGGENVHFEVVRIREHKAYRMPGMAEDIPAGEHYPGAESWGRDGFTFMDRDEAEARFVELSTADTAR